MALESFSEVIKMRGTIAIVAAAGLVALVGGCTGEMKGKPGMRAFENSSYFTADSSEPVEGFAVDGCDESSLIFSKGYKVYTFGKKKLIYTGYRVECDNYSYEHNESIEGTNPENYFCSNGLSSADLPEKRSGLSWTDENCDNRFDTEGVWSMGGSVSLGLDCSSGNCIAYVDRPKPKDYEQVHQAILNSDAMQRWRNWNQSQ